MKAHQVKEVVNHTREVFIYETWTTDDITQARRKSVKADTSKRLFMGGDGSLEMYVELTRTMVSSGGIAYVNVGVKNLTKKKVRIQSQSGFTIPTGQTSHIIFFILRCNRLWASNSLFGDISLRLIRD